MSNKNEAINAVNRAIGFIRGSAHHELSNTFVKELNHAIDFMVNTGQHEEYKAAWLNILNTLHGIDPDWQEKSQGESEWEKAVAFIGRMDKAQHHIVINCEGIDENTIRKFKDAFSEGLRGQKTLFVGEWALPSEPLKMEAIKQIIEEIDHLPRRMDAPEEAGMIVAGKAAGLDEAIRNYLLRCGSLEPVRRQAAQLGAAAMKVLMNIPCTYYQVDAKAKDSRNG
ncbi:hypothetical protein B194_2000 [Serratia plymuthica A30]|uniref:hypothetical protein n=1 Tax=Serratia plymuthica TaxID=82996 RepID=UPI0002A2220F|nr:hypothetical protein [Serratia plymuthica]EKF65047.1 hypothetical protein B194_2000 [Serratia plymuthica A30]